MAPIAVSVLSSGLGVPGMRILRLIATILISGCVAAGLGQTPASTPASTASNQANSSEVSEGDVLKMNTRLVQVPFTVVDRKHAPVPRLGQEHFRVFEDGVEQTIANFEPIEQPLTVALLLDTSPSTRFRLEDIREAAIAFVNQLGTKDRLMVLSFSDHVQVLTELTSNRELARNAIKSATAGNATRLFDAIALVDEKLKTIQGRKAVIVFTDGIDNASRFATAQNTLYAAEESDLLVYPVQYDTFADITEYARLEMANGVTKKTERVYPPGLGPKDYERATAYLMDLAATSGGRFYHAGYLKGVKHAFSLIAAELRSQYALAYYPHADRSEKEKRRHEISVRVDQLNLVVRARQSYIR